MDGRGRVEEGRGEREERKVPWEEGGRRPGGAPVGSSGMPHLCLRVPLDSLKA